MVLNCEKHSKIHKINDKENIQNKTHDSPIKSTKATSKSTGKYII